MDDFLDWGIEALVTLFSGEDGSILTSLFTNAPEISIEALNQLEVLEQMHLDQSGMELDYASFLSGNDAEILSNLNEIPTTDSAVFGGDTSQFSDSNESLLQEEESGISDKEHKKPSSAEVKANYITSTAANLSAIAIATNSGKIYDGILAMGRYLWEELKVNTAGEAPITRQNDPVKNEMLGLCNSQAPPAKKVERLVIHQKPTRVDLIMSADAYLTEDRADAFQPKTVTSEAGTFHKLGELWSKLIRTTFFVMEKHEAEIQGLAFFTLDFPNPQSSGVNLYTRMRKYIGSNEIRYYNISQDLPYAMQPMFPRLVFTDGRVEDIPNEWRFEIMQHLRNDTIYFRGNEGLKLFDKKQKFFTKRERRLMLAYLEVEEMEDITKDDVKLRKIREIMSVNTHKKELPQETIREIWKSIDGKCKIAFRTQFMPKRHAVHYWLEMGLYIDPPE